MEKVSIIEGFQPDNNPILLEKAEGLKPELKSTIIMAEKLSKADGEGMKAGDEVCFDFGDHYVGYITIRFSHQGSHPDAPSFIKLKFAEVQGEIAENSADYSGWISKGWLQEEWIHIDSLPAVVRLHRRYAFRYLQVQVIDTSLKYQLNVDEVTCEAVSAVAMDEFTNFLEIKDMLLKRIDQVSIRTLMNCMQDVFEDGPKRDRRLWIGDLRLQAKVNYKTFQNYNLVKRCLYLFAGSKFPDGRVSANIFTDGKIAADDSYLADYALFFVPILADYYAETKDRETLNDLYEVAIHQINMVMTWVDCDGIIREEDTSKNEFYCFIDWNEKLNKQASLQGVLIYCLRHALMLAKEMKDSMVIEKCKQNIELLVTGTKEQLYDESEMLFISGAEKQISTASQVWMVLAGVFDNDTNRKILRKIKEIGLPYHMVTPYMVHHYCEALIQTGETEEALSVVKNYWGKMVELGADTFWEAFNPENPSESPYGGSMVNSYCHAWSCTPAYLFREYDLI